MRRVLVGIALAALSRGAQGQDSLAFVDRETGAALSRIIQTAGARGLPTARIVAKASFAARVAHAPSARIIETAQAVADRLETARGAIAFDTLSADIEAGEEALSFKIPKSILTKIHQAAPASSIAVPLGVLTQLVASRVPADRAGEIVTDLIRRGATPGQLLALGNNVSSDVQSGARAIESIETRFHGLTPLLTPGATSVSADAPIGTASGPKKP